MDEQELRFTRQELDLMTLGLLDQSMRAMLAYCDAHPEMDAKEAASLRTTAHAILLRCDATAKHGLRHDPLDDAIDTTRSLVDDIVSAVETADAEMKVVQVHGGFVREGDTAWATTIQGKVLMIQVKHIVTVAQIYCLELNWTDGSPVSYDEVMLRQDAIYLTREAAVAAAKEQAKWRASIEAPGA